MKKKLLLMVLVMSMIMLYGTGCGSDDSSSGGTIKFTVGSETSDNTNTGKALKKFEESLEERTDGKVDVDLQLNGVIGADVEMIEQVQMGSIQMTLPSSSLFNSYDERLGIWDIPFLFESNQAVQDAYNGELGEQYDSWMAEQGFECFGIVPTGFRALSNTKHEVSTPEDMEDLKIRVMESDTYVDTFDLLGANTVTMNYSDVYSALQQGTIDGQDNPAEFTVTSGFYELTPYYTKLNHVMSVMPVIGSTEFMEGLDEETRQIITEEIQKMVKELTASFAEAEEGYLQEMEEAGVQITELTDSERQAFVAKVQPVQDKFRESLGDDLIDLALSFNK